MHWGFYWFSLKFLPKAGAATPINNVINILSGAQVSLNAQQSWQEKQWENSSGWGPGLELNSLTCPKGLSQEGGC